MNLSEGTKAVLILLFLAITTLSAETKQLKYNNPGLLVDLGVGLWAWPLPMDYDKDGDVDLVVSCPDVPYNGIYFFENPDGNVKMPTFKPAVKIADGMFNISPSYVNGKARVLVPGEELTMRKGVALESKEIYPDKRIHPDDRRIRGQQWKYADFDGDGALDLIVAAGDWTDYGWEDAYNEKGEWVRGPLRASIYWIRNTASTDKPTYAKPELIKADGKPVDVYGKPSPNFADFDGDGDLDLLCGEFVDSFTYFQNIGTRARPVYQKGQPLMRNGEPFVMELCMIVPVALDWDRDGDVDLIVGKEDGRVALVEHTGSIKDGMPVFAEPKFFQQQADAVKFGVANTPVSFDWDGDGDEDLVCGNTAGYIGFIENLDGGNPPRWAPPVRLEAGGKTIRIQAGPNGSIQGPCERKWGYTALSVADWDHDGLADLVVNSIWGKVIWFRNIGTRRAPKLAKAAPIEVEWTGPAPKPAWNWWTPRGNELATQWRTTPVVVDWDQDGLNDLLMLDHEGYFAFFQRQRRGDRVVLLPGKRLFEGNSYDGWHRDISTSDTLMCLNNGLAGESGRRKICVDDWDGDGLRDILVDGPMNCRFLRNISPAGPPWKFEDKGPLSEVKLAEHSTSPTTVDYDGDGKRDLLLGAEDGFLYLITNDTD